MQLRMIKNNQIDTNTVTIEYKVLDENVERVAHFVKHMQEVREGFQAVLDGKICFLKIEDVLYIEAVDRKTFCYTLEQVYELEERLYELEERYKVWDYVRISKSFIVNLQRVKALKPDFGGRILATMDNGEKLYISRQYAGIIKEKLGLGGKRS